MPQEQHGQNSLHWEKWVWFIISRTRGAWPNFKNAFPLPLPSSQAQLHSWFLYLSSSQWHRGRERGGYGQWILLRDRTSHTVSLLQCGSLPWVQFFRSSDPPQILPASLARAPFSMAHIISQFCIRQKEIFCRVLTDDTTVATLQPKPWHTNPAQVMDTLGKGCAVKGMPRPSKEARRRMEGITKWSALFPGKITEQNCIQFISRHLKDKTIITWCWGEGGRIGMAYWDFGGLKSIMSVLAGTKLWFQLRGFISQIYFSPKFYFSCSPL